MCKIQGETRNPKRDLKHKEQEYKQWDSTLGHDKYDVQREQQP